MAETLPPLPNRIPGTAITGNHRGTVPLSNAECCRQANKEAKNNRIPEGRQLYEKGWEKYCLGTGRRSCGKESGGNYCLYLFLLPAVVFIGVFCYAPCTG